MKPSLGENPDHFTLHVCANDLNTERSPKLIVKSIVDLDDNSKLNEKGCGVNAHLAEMCKERKLNLINHSKKIKPNHLNWGKLHLIQKGSKVLDDAFLKEISNVFNWHYSRLNLEGSKSKFSLEDKKRIDAKTILKSIRQENINKFLLI